MAKPLSAIAASAIASRQLCNQKICRPWNAHTGPARYQEMCGSMYSGFLRLLAHPHNLYRPKLLRRLEQFPSRCIPGISDCHGERSRATFCFHCRETKGGSTPRPNSFLLVESSHRVRSSAAPAAGARRSGRHDILLRIWIHQHGNCSTSMTCRNAHSPVAAWCSSRDRSLSRLSLSARSGL